MAFAATGTFNPAGASTSTTGGASAPRATSAGRIVPVEFTFASNPDADVHFFASCNKSTLFNPRNRKLIKSSNSALRREMTQAGACPLMLQPGEHLGIDVVAKEVLGGASEFDSADGGSGLGINESVTFTKLTIGGVNMLAAAQSGRRGDSLSAAQNTALVTAFPTGVPGLADSIKMVSIPSPQRLQGLDTATAAVAVTAASDTTNPVGHTLVEFENPLRVGLANVDVSNKTVRVPIGTRLFSHTTAEDASVAFDDSEYVLEAFTGTSAAPAYVVPTTLANAVNPSNFDVVATTRPAFRIV